MIYVPGAMSRSAALILLYATFIATAQSDLLDLECSILQTLDDLKDRLTSAEGTISQLSVENADLKNSRTSANAEIAYLKDSLTGAKTEIAELKDVQASAENLHNDLRDSLTGAEMEVANLKQSLTELTSRTTHSTYVRWGRSNCPGNGSDLVYAGYAGGSAFNHTGAAVDYLCLPTNPDFSHYKDNVQNGGYVYGVEYRMTHTRDDSMAFFPESDQAVDLNFQDVPCAVCRTVRSTVLMVPAKTTCHDGWTLEYKGYLSSGHYNHTAASQYVCLDDQPEYIPGGGTRYEASKRLLFVEGRCGSLNCPPYVEGRELTCAVCSV